MDSVNDLGKQMKDLLVDPWKKSAGERSDKLRPYLVVIDALDEIEDKGGLEFLQQLLETMRQGDLHGLKFLVTSRPDPDLAALCKESVDSISICRLYEVLRDTVKADIAQYLRVKLPELKDESGLTELSLKADGLFIYAATAVKYILPRDKMSPEEQLKRLRKLVDHMPVSGTPSLIDKLYQQILWAAFSDLDDDERCDRKKILHTLLCTEERVSTSTACKLSDLTDVKMAKTVVEELHAVLYVNEDRVLWYHASFPDFMFNQARSRFSIPGETAHHDVVDLSCNNATHNSLLTDSCFRIMEFGLRFNICDLPSSFLFDSEVPDLSRRTQENIGDALRYSCRYWAQHLGREDSGSGDSLRVKINEFLHVRVLFWIEAMNLLGWRAQCSPMLQRAREWILKVGDLRLLYRLWLTPRFRGMTPNILKLHQTLPRLPTLPPILLRAKQQSQPHIFISQA